MSRASAFLLSGLLILVGASAKAAEPFNWNGPYVGLNAGYYWVHQDWFDVDSWFNGQTITTRPDGGAVGGTVGYNYVLNGLLLGVEADLDWLSVTAQNRVNNLTYRVGTTSTRPQPRPRPISTATRRRRPRPRRRATRRRRRASSSNRIGPGPARCGHGPACRSTAASYT